MKDRRAELGLTPPRKATVAGNGAVVSDLSIFLFCITLISIIFKVPLCLTLAEIFVS